MVSEVACPQITRRAVSKSRDDQSAVEERGKQGEWVLVDSGWVEYRLTVGGDPVTSGGRVDRGSDNNRYTLRSYPRSMSCIFCGAEGKMSREHVFPRWLEELFPDLGEVDYLRRLVTFSTDEHHERPGPSFDVVVKDVCRNCNHGWMGRLEGQARPILTPMLLDEPRLLTAVEQHIAATWATKTMLTMQGANIGGERVVSLERYRWFYEHQMPLSGSHIWLCRYSDRSR